MRKYDRLWEYIKRNDKQALTLRFEEIEAIAGTSVDHSFLNEKKALAAYHWKVAKISMKERKVFFERERLL